MITMPYSGDYINSYLSDRSNARSTCTRSSALVEGESIDWAMYEGIMYMSQYYLVDYLNDGVKWPRAGARNQNLCGIGVYKCADGFIALNLFGIRQNKWMHRGPWVMGDVWGIARGAGRYGIAVALHADRA